MKIVDIYSKKRGYAGRLSNFTERHFTFDGVECCSLEGVLQSFKFSDIEKQKQCCRLVGIHAKRFGENEDWKTNQTLYWQGIEYKRDGIEYQSLLDRLYSTVFENSFIPSRKIKLFEMADKHFCFIFKLFGGREKVYLWAYNPLKYDLICSQGVTLTHSIGKDDIRDTILTTDEFISRLCYEKSEKRAVG